MTQPTAAAPGFDSLDTLAELAASASGAAHRGRLALHAADGVLALLAGLRTAEGQAAHAFYTRLEPTPLGAAAGLAAALRLTEIDDIHRATVVTATSIALPAALAMGARARGEGREVPSTLLLDALFVGYEVSVRMVRALGGARMVDKGMWPSYVVAPVGAAAVAGRMLGLDAGRMRHALALALSQTPRIVGKSPGVRPGRWALFGNAVRSGCVAALAAADGIDGDTTILNAGWLQATGAPDPLLLGASSSSSASAASEAVIDQLSIKPHCSAKQALAAVHGMRRLVAEGLDPGTIDAVEVHVPTAYAGMLDREPPQASRLASMVSVRWQLALAALRPELLDDVGRERFPQDAALMALAGKVTVHADKGLDALYPARFPARLVVVAGGRRQEILVEDSPGDPALRYSPELLLDKAVRILGAGADVELVRQVVRFGQAAEGIDLLFDRFFSMRPA